jgi:hypothetical protein
VSDPSQPGIGATDPRDSKLPSERDWERAALLQAQASTRHPELVSDGGEVSFALGALAGPAEPLDPSDPAAGALLAHLAVRAAPKRGAHMPWKRATGDPSALPSLEGWRALARGESEALFALAVPGKLLTVSVRRGARNRWKCTGPHLARPLRAARNGIRASSWRADPTQAIDPDAGELRVLVTEQSFANGQRAYDRVLAPEIYVDAEEVVIRMFVTPRPGFQGGAPNPETPARIALPQPLGSRRLIDGAQVQLGA